MKHICADCGRLFEGVVCEHCEKERLRPAVITVSRVVPEEPQEPDGPPKTWRGRLAERKKKRREKRALRKQARDQRRSERRAQRAKRLEEHPTYPRRSRFEASQTLQLCLSGQMRRAVHYVTGSKGGDAWLPLLPLCLFLPLSFACALVLIGRDYPANSVEALELFWHSLKPALGRCVLLWLEGFVLLVLLIRMQAVATRGSIKPGGALGLVVVSQLPLTLFSAPIVVCCFLLPVASAVLMLVGVMQMVVVLFIGVEYNSLDRRTGVLGSFSFMMGVFVLIFAALTAAMFMDDPAAVLSLKF